VTTPPHKQPDSVLARMVNAQKREAKHMLTELLAVRGLMPLLMKPRNGGNWTPAERAELIGQLRRLSRLSPYLLFLLLPGSALLLPGYAWWLDRRRGLRQHLARATPVDAVTTTEPAPESLPDSQRP